MFILLGLEISIVPGYTKVHWDNPWNCFGLILVIDYQWKKEELGVIMSKNIESQLNVVINEYISAASLLTLNDDNIEELTNKT